MTTTATAPEVQIETLNLENIASKTMFLSISFNRFGNTRTADVEVKTEADQDRFSKTKKILKSDELKAIQKADTAFRLWLDSPIRCWRYKSGMRLVPKSQVSEVYKACKEYRDVQRPPLVKQFLEVYEDQKEQSRNDLKEQFRESDYPSKAEVESEFSFAFNFMNFGTPEDLKTIDPEMYEEQKQKAHEDFMDAATEMRKSMRLVFDEMVGHLLEILSPSADGKKKKIYDSTVTKLQEFLNTFDIRNVTDDAELQAQVGKLKLIMAGVDAEKLRESDNLKVDIAAKLQEAKAGMGALVQEKFIKIR